MDKMTYNAALTAAIECGALSTEVVEKLTALRAQMEKKAVHAAHKPTANQVANDGFKGDILATMDSGAAMTVTEIMKATPTLDGVSNQRVSAILRQMTLDNTVIREEVKGKAYFHKA